MLYITCLSLKVFYKISVQQSMYKNEILVLSLTLWHNKALSAKFYLVEVSLKLLVYG